MKTIKLEFYVILKIVKSLVFVIYYIYIIDKIVICKNV